MKRFKPIFGKPVCFGNVFRQLKSSTVTISLAESTIDYSGNSSTIMLHVGTLNID